MPYNPSVRNITGELAARKGEIWGETFANIGKAIGNGIQQFTANQAMAKTGAAKFGAAVQQDQDLKKFIDSGQAPLEVTKAVEKLGKGKLSHVDAAVLATFADTWSEKKKEQQAEQARRKELQLLAQTAQLNEQKLRAYQQEQEAMAKLLKFGQYQDGVGKGVLGPEVQAGMDRELSRNPLLSSASQAASTLGRMPTMEDIQRMQQPGGSPTSAMKDTDAIIASELAAGKIKKEQVTSRRAELLAAGGRDPGSRFDNAGTFVDTKTGQNARIAVKDRNTGQIGFAGSDGSFEPIDPSKWKPSTVSDTNPYLDPPGMEKLRAKVIEDERSVRQLGRYLGGFESLEQGIGQLADRAAKSIKTIFTKEPLTEEEKAVGIQQGRLQQIIGGLRTAVVGPGVMTEQDAQRIVDALGGDISALQNQEIVSSLIGEILQEKMKEYESDLEIYNTHAANKYGGAGYKQRERVNVEFRKPKTSATTPASPATASRVSSKSTEELEKRLQQLRGGK